jgi:hypothetical protein
MKSNEVVLSDIESKIYLIRGQKVMLDEDLAELYQVPTKRLNEQVRRNLERFPPDFMFILTEQEVGRLRSQFATSKMGRGGRRYAPLVFTEQGIAMLSSVLGSKQAIDVNIAIMRTFVRLREVLSSDRKLEKKITELESRFEGKFKIVFDAIKKLMTSPPVQHKRIIGLAREDD